MLEKVYENDIQNIMLEFLVDARQIFELRVRCIAFFSKAAYIQSMRRQIIAIRERRMRFLRRGILERTHALKEKCKAVTKGKKGVGVNKYSVIQKKLNKLQTLLLINYEEPMTLTDTQQQFITMT